MLVDGAEHQLGLIRAEAARRGTTIHVIIDTIHVLEYIWGAGWSLHKAGDPAAEEWGAVKALMVLAGDSDRAAAEITAEANAAGLEGSQRHGADACVRNLNSKREYLRYDQTMVPREMTAEHRESPRPRPGRWDARAERPSGAALGHRERWHDDRGAARTGRNQGQAG